MLGMFEPSLGWLNSDFSFFQYITSLHVSESTWRSAQQKRSSQPSMNQRLPFGPGRSAEATVGTVTNSFVFQSFQLTPGFSPPFLEDRSDDVLRRATPSRSSASIKSA